MHAPSQEHPIRLPPLVFDEPTAHRRRSSSGFPALSTHLASTSSSMHLPFDSPFSHHASVSGSSLPGPSSHGSRTLPRLHIPSSHSSASAPQWGTSPFSPVASLRPTFSALPTPPVTGSAPAPSQFQPMTSPIGWRAPSPPLSAGPSTYALHHPNPHVSTPLVPSPPARTTRFDPVRDAQSANNAGAGPSSVVTGERRSLTGSPTPRADDGDDHPQL